jgi:hypothetical protein
MVIMHSRWCTLAVLCCNRRNTWLISSPNLSSSHLSPPLPCQRRTPAVATALPSLCSTPAHAPRRHPLEVACHSFPRVCGDNGRPAHKNSESTPLHQPSARFTLQSYLGTSKMLQLIGDNGCNGWSAIFP